MLQANNSCRTYIGKKKAEYIGCEIIALCRFVENVRLFLLLLLYQKESRDELPDVPVFANELQLMIKITLLSHAIYFALMNAFKRY